ncbi:MAG: Nif11-like leader peptide family natural product precursor [Rivularia sp. (in: cyanobacteria)]
MKTTTDLEKFYQELLKDSMMQERLKAATDPDCLSKLVVEMGNEKGYSFTKEEVQAAMSVEAFIREESVEFGEPLLSSLALGAFEVGSMWNLRKPNYFPSFLALWKALTTGNETSFLSEGFYYKHY